MMPKPVTCSCKYGTMNATPTTDTNPARYLLPYRRPKKSDSVCKPYLRPSSQMGGRMKNDTTYPRVR